MAARAKRIAAGEAMYIERGGTWTQLRTTESNVFDVFVALRNDLRRACEARGAWVALNFAISDLLGKIPL